MIMRLQCVCGRNLADVTVTYYNADWVFPINYYAPRPWRRNDAYLMVTPRSNVDQREYQPPGAAMERTYSWLCRCRDPSGRRRNPKRTAEKIARAWDAQLFAVTPEERGRTRKVVVAVLDVDL